MFSSVILAVYLIAIIFVAVRVGKVEIWNVLYKAAFFALFLFLIFAIMHDAGCYLDWWEPLKLTFGGSK